MQSISERCIVYLYSRSNDIDKAQYGSMVFSIKKHHLNLNCLTSLIDRSKFGWQSHRRYRYRYLHRITST